MIFIHCHSQSFREEPQETRQALLNLTQLTNEKERIQKPYRLNPRGHLQKTD
jgi:hypothetical protein